MDKKLGSPPCHFKWKILLLKLFRAEVSQIRVALLSVALTSIHSKNGAPGLLPCSKRTAMDQHPLQISDEAFHRRTIITVLLVTSARPPSSIAMKFLLLNNTLLIYNWNYLKPFQ